ncbi:hypothetical protein [Streptodolium elevatio]|uniref:DUF11 domain-containing protein n=1 Tax=Streptodolium elevatio TaxID=3157996 RepID=A0ABV3DC93_9ACTN
MRGRKLGVAAISGLLVLGSTGIADAAPATLGSGASADLPRAAAETNADSALTIGAGKPKTKKGKVYATLTYKFSNKGPTATATGDLKTSALEGVAFDKVPKGCSKESNSAICPLKPLKKGATKKLEFTVVLTGTHHKVDAIALGGQDPDIRNKTVAFAWDTPKPAPKPKPSSKPSGSSSSKPSKPAKCPATRIEWSSDGGRTWKRSGLLNGFHPKLNVRLADKVEDRCKYTVSYASYSAEGPTWKTSGKQSYLGKHTVTLTGKKPTAVLDISKFLPRCYGQVDLYGSGEKFDGKRLPHYPDKKYPTRMIAGWNGGKACTTPPSSSPPPSSQSASPSPSKSPSKSPSPSASTPTQPSTRPPSTTPGTTAPVTTPPPTSTTPTPTPTPTETPTTTPPPPVDTPEPPDDQAPVPDTPENPPSADDQRDVTEPPYVEGSLPRTGASRVPYMIAFAVFSLLLGILAVAWSRWGPRGAFSSQPRPAPAGGPWGHSRRDPRGY